MRPSRSLQRQQGVVIVLAMLMVALMAAMAYVMVESLVRDTHRTELILQDAKANGLAKGAVLWAKDQLNANYLKRKPTRVVDTMPLLLPESSIEGFHIKSQLDDMQAKYNINNVSADGGPEALLKLMKTVLPETNEQTSLAIIKALIDDEHEGITDSSLERYYAELPTPTRAAHRLLTHVSELKLVKGMTPTLYQALLPYIVALPQVTSINPQTASAPVIASSDEKMTLETAQALIEARKDTPLVSVDQLRAMPLMANHQIDEKKLNPVSTYFLLTTEVTAGENTWVTTTLLERMIIGGRSHVRVVWQNRGEA